MNNDIEVSVYCTTYNHEKYIRDTLEGFVSQKTDFKYEIIIHDDRSTDNTVKIIDEYKKKYPNLITTIYEKENQYSKGVRITDTFIVPIMRGKLVAVCEGDDYWTDKTKLQRQYDFLNSHHEYVACVHNTYLLDARNGKKKLMYKSIGDHDVTFSDTVRAGSYAFHTSSLMYRYGAVLNKPDFYEKMKFCDDYQKAILLSLRGKIWFIDRPMSCYRIFNENSWTEKNFTANDIKSLDSEFNQLCDMLDSLNTYTGYCYDDLLYKVKLQHEYTLNERKKNFKALSDKKYKNVWSDYPLIFRVKRKIKRFFEIKSF
ncbi:glycosyltransferase [Bilifractor sp. LCP21S3_A7]|uniref:glycosyltransferase n=1 Tax=Bilifractor sp. LCP21S3_A7 TaxID=3438738 RepID=UPI003F8EA478